MSAFDATAGDDAMKKFRQAVSATPGKPIIAREEPRSSKSSLKREAAALDTLIPGRRLWNRTSSASSSCMPSSFNHSSVLVDLESQVFPKDRVALDDLGFVNALEESRTSLLKVMSICHYAQSELHSARGDVHRLRTVNINLKRDLDLEAERRELADKAKEGEIDSLKKKDAALEELLKASAIKLEELHLENERLIQKLDLSTSAATIHTRWKMISEFKRGLAPDWDVLKAEKEYREVMIFEAKLDGKPEPIFPMLYCFGEDVLPPAE